jgi:chaperonin cofactor prefoldin
MIEDAEEDLENSKNRLEEEIKRCDDSNKWVEEFLKSIE